MRRQPKKRGDYGHHYGQRLKNLFFTIHLAFKYSRELPLRHCRAIVFLVFSSVDVSDSRGTF
jgi:hypothetical protein